MRRHQSVDAPDRATMTKPVVASTAARLIWLLLLPYTLLLALLAAVRSLLDAVRRTVLRQEECPLCCGLSWLVSGNDGSCSHRCCRGCWRRYLRVGEQNFVNLLKRRRRKDVVCCWGCTEPMSSRAVRRHGPRAVSELCSMVEKREEFVSRSTHSFGLVDCPSCSVGVGYDDGSQATAMCFLCEHQWPLAGRSNPLCQLGELVTKLWPRDIIGMGVAAWGWRPCPHCVSARLAPPARWLRPRSIHPLSRVCAGALRVRPSKRTVAAQ